MFKKLYQLSKLIDDCGTGILPAAIDAYKQRMGIEEMFRDCKK